MNAAERNAIDRPCAIHSIPRVHFERHLRARVSPSSQPSARCRSRYSRPYHAPRPCRPPSLPAPRARRASADRTIKSSPSATSSTQPRTQRWPASGPATKPPWVPYNVWRRAGRADRHGLHRRHLVGIRRWQSAAPPPRRRRRLRPAHGRARVSAAQHLRAHPRQAERTPAHQDLKASRHRKTWCWTRQVLGHAHRAARLWIEGHPACGGGAPDATAMSEPSKRGAWRFARSARERRARAPTARPSRVPRGWLAAHLHGIARHVARRARRHLANVRGAVSTADWSTTADASAAPRRPPLHM